MIVELYLKRDEAAIMKTAEKFGKRLVSLAYAIVKDRNTAEECENDTYIRAWGAIPPHEPRNYLYAFLACITRRLSLNCCRDMARLKRSAFICELSCELEQCIPAPDDVACRLEDAELKKVINNFLAHIGEEKRNIFIRRYWYMDSIADIAMRFNASESKIKMSLYRCREKLRLYLEKEGYVL